MPAPINVGIIGCGGFVRGMHIPNLKANPKFKIRAVMDINEKAASSLQADSGAEYATADVEKIHKDKEIGLVLITTRHDSHAELSIKAAKAGKHILCEKPMGLNIDECRQIADAVRQNKVKYTVGYNRGIAPHIVKAKNLLKTCPEKKLIYHRIQAPFPESHWTHDPKIGGGRFVGEGCHIFDLLCELISAPPVSVFAAGSTFLNPSIVKIPDSAAVTITFADGSVGTTIIASAGCGQFPKEATEIYCAGKAIYIQDFKEMDYYGFEGPGKYSISLPQTDKGQATEIDQLADAIINNTEPPNGLAKAARAALISYKVNESIAKGVPVPINEKEYNF